MRTLRVGGMTPLTTIDYPGELAAVVFCQGCPWRCRYCHNPELLDRKAPTLNDWDAVLDFLRRRIGLLDAVVFSGGEPTAQSALSSAMETVTDLGFHIGLHTAGSYPERLEKLLPRVNWVGLDVKALPDDYPRLTGVDGSGERAWKSLALLAESGLEFQVRITRHPALLPDLAMQGLLQRLRGYGVDQPTIQPCRTQSVLDPSLSDLAALP